MDEELKLYCGVCPDKACLTQLYFWPSEEVVDCDQCLQTHDVRALLHQHQAEKKMKSNYLKARAGPDFVKVSGLSNFRCKLLSPLLTTYGMDRSGNSKLLKDLGHTETIDCGKVLGSRSFMISPDHINIMGYGKDRSGSLVYLRGFFDLLKDFHGGEERLVAIHADGDGHCLVHALSRALTGRELFWHGLRRNLYDHLKSRLADYMELFKDFHDKGEWTGIIEEANPNCTSSGQMTAGLGNIHIFALSNILKRPVILFDSPQKMRSSGDYTGLFVPALTDPEECTNRSPLCIAWSGEAHNHFVALVAVEGREIPHIPATLIPDLWGVSSEVASRYLLYNEDGSLTVCSGKSIRISYLQKLSAAMETEFIRHHFIAPFLVEDLHRYVYSYNELLGVSHEELTRIAALAVMEHRLFRCLKCKALQEAHLYQSYLAPGGELYDLAVELHGKLRPNRLYAFPNRKVLCEYNTETDMLSVVGCMCAYCLSEDTRHVDQYGKVCYINGDVTETKSLTNGYKYHWDGNEYDNKPMKFKLTVSRNDKQIKAPITWFYGDSNPSLNSDPAREAEQIVHKYFPEEVENENFIKELSEIISTDCIELLGTGKKFVETNLNPTTFENASTSSNHFQGGASEPMQIEKDDTNQYLSSSSGHNRSGEPSAGSLQPALKRKSSGELAPLNAVRETREKKVSASTQIVVKVCLSGVATRTLKLDPDVDYVGLQEEIFRALRVEPDQQILKHDFPPKLLVAPANGGSLSLKAGDKIQVTVKQPSVPKELMSRSSFEDFDLSKRSVSSALVFDKLTETALLHQSYKRSGCSSLSEYALDRPELFHPGGYFYEEFKQDLGLNPSLHCRLPLLSNYVFYYNQNHDRLDLCLESVGHFPIDEEVKFVIKKHTKSPSQNLSSVDGSKTLHSDAKLQSDELHKPSKDTPDGLVETSRTLPQKPVSLAPGYRTLNELPTEISNEEKAAQVDALKKKMEEMKAKRSEGSTKAFIEGTQSKELLAESDEAEAEQPDIML